MLVQPPIEELLPKADSRYSLAMMVAKRTRQLVDGAQPMVPETTPNLVTLACEEIVAGKVVGIPGMHTPFVPLRPEIEEARRLAKEQAENQAALDAFPDLIDIRPTEEKSSTENVEENRETLNPEVSEEDSEKMVTDDETDGEIEDINEEDVRDLALLDGAETEDAE